MTDFNDNATKKIHDMNLNPEPFEAIRSGNKTVEMRLNDEKRAKIEKGDFIKFTNNKTSEILLVRVTDKIVYPDFETLYKHHDKISIGYKENEMADPTDMLIYYNKDKVAKYGALALIIEII